MNPAPYLVFAALLLAGSQALGAQNAASAKPDALEMYRNARDLESVGKTADANSLYSQAIAICDKELASDTRRMDAWSVKCWCLFRLGRHQEVIDQGSTALKISFDARIVEQMGESYFYLGDNDKTLSSFRKYIESGQYLDRLSTAYFFIGETYLRMRRWAHADIAYATALKREPSIPRWWYRLGLACEQLGEWQRASDAFSKALALNPSLKEASDALARVKPKIGT